MSRDPYIGSREEEQDGERQAGEYASPTPRPESGEPPIGERRCPKCGWRMMLHRKGACPVERNTLQRGDAA